MPHYGLERFGMRRDMDRVDGWNDHACVGRAGGMAAVPAYDAENGSARRAGEFKRRDQIGADVLFQIAAADGEDKYCIALARPADLEPTLLVTAAKRSVKDYLPVSKRRAELGPNLVHASHASALRLSDQVEEFSRKSAFLHSATRAHTLREY